MPLATIRSALAMDRVRAFAANRSIIFCMQRGLIRSVRVAHHPAKVEPVIVRNFAPALPGPVQRDNVVETLASGVRQQMRFL
jgi:hypothetical protein